MLATDYDKSNRSHLPKITIEVIPHDEQERESISTWDYNENGELVIKISSTSHKNEFVTALHALTEACLCDLKGISPKTVIDFEEDFASMRDEYGYIIGDKKSGDEENAPHHHEYAMAKRVARWIGESCGVDMQEYDKTINSLKKF